VWNGDWKPFGEIRSLDEVAYRIGYDPLSSPEDHSGSPARSRVELACGEGEPVLGNDDCEVRMQLRPCVDGREKLSVDQVADHIGRPEDLEKGKLLLRLKRLLLSARGQTGKREEQAR
jgi:hypothetical protein